MQWFAVRLCQRRHDTGSNAQTPHLAIAAALVTCYVASQHLELTALHIPVGQAELLARPGTRKEVVDAVDGDLPPAARGVLALSGQWEVLNLKYLVDRAPALLLPLMNHF